MSILLFYFIRYRQGDTGGSGRSESWRTTTGSAAAGRGWSPFYSYNYSSCLVYDPALKATAEQSPRGPAVRFSPGSSPATKDTATI